jgi:hypothetical protein
MRVKAVNEIGPEARKRVAPAVRGLLRKCREAIPSLVRRGAAQRRGGLFKDAKRPL